MNNRLLFGNLVRITIPKIDRFSTDRPTLPYKIIEITENNKYCVELKFEIIEIYYSISKLESLIKTENFPELDEIISNKIIIRKAAHLQSTKLVLGRIYNCKSECNSNKYYSKKMNKCCNNRYQ